MWFSQLEHLENEYIVAKTHIVGHNVCDNVADLPDVLEIPGVEVVPEFQATLSYCRTAFGMYYSSSFPLITIKFSFILSVIL